MQRGFKSWCENAAIQIRRELGLKPFEMLDPWLLAQHLDIQIWTPEEVPGFEARYLRQLVQEDPDSWSAVTLCVDSKDLILLNPTHSKARQASDLMHELSHILIGHEPARVDVTEDGLLMLNNYNGEQEEEAKWLSGCLLLPRALLISIRKQRQDLRLAARRYGVSKDMLTFRLNVTGVARQFQRIVKNKVPYV